ncbi:MAG: 50S ribosomal protein L6 [Alphaproteobacteria bacterium RIFCSPLOWO2_01_FULL_45_8]|nr:MAG: 50S ribosomal protein L6 [Alphaproteobacteria bacterium GWB1_45_5]OFW76033.1 MAG: 50S ribosomal protein L6 [Alphaproteobacteria bacterium GWA1_45_9]OFW90074.1 MAG: 50S ribosomal protein L6 [Alphaproteobacteria bacterium RIFCSPHIGHO2_01_FULL_41_14]OFW96527.1 MAG: 50S ribosomal protein L6 [Alphaproteobacteria bacterium RIFCSPLOWO2_01_FULL_45_8]HCI48549.1 50S ribosomal protein L6 [Holosporales bacterium]
MSRIGKNPIIIPAGVTVDLTPGLLKARGSRGELSVALHSSVEVTYADSKILVHPRDESKVARSMWGTVRNLIANLVEGVTKGFSVNLEISGVGYRAAVQGSNLVMQLGYSHEVVYAIPQGITIKCEKPTSITVSGASRQRVGQIAAEIRGFRRPEPYKGKGIKYENERIVRKEGKKK